MQVERAGDAGPSGAAVEARQQTVGVLGADDLVVEADLAVARDERERRHHDAAQGAAAE